MARTKETFTEERTHRILEDLIPELKRLEKEAHEYSEHYKNKILKPNRRLYASKKINN